MSNVQLFLAVPFEVGAPDAFIQSLQAFLEQLLAGQNQTGAPNPVLVAGAPVSVVTRPASPGDVGSIANSFLAKLGATPTPGTVAMVSAWIGCEKGSQPAQWNNPMNTTLPTSHSIGEANSVHVQIFDTLDNGLDANVSTLQQDNMTALRQALLAGDATAFARAFNQVPWGTSAQCVAHGLGVAL